MGFNAINNESSKSNESKKGLIDIWKVPLSADLTQIRELYSYLNLEEISIADQIKNNIIRNKRIIARGNLRRILAYYLGIGPQEVEFTYEKNCKPNLKNTSIYFNLSHSWSYALIAFSHYHPVGIDLEEIKDIDYQSIIPIFFSLEEETYLHNLNPSKQLREFYKIWTLKEAYLKTIGTGLSQDPSTINILSPLNENSDSDCGRDSNRDSKSNSNWGRVNSCLLNSIAPLPSYIGAVSVYSPDSIEPLLKYHDLEIENEKLPTTSTFWRANVG